MWAQTTASSRPTVETLPSLRQRRGVYPWLIIWLTQRGGTPRQGDWGAHVGNHTVRTSYCSAFQLGKGTRCSPCRATGLGSAISQIQAPFDSLGPPAQVGNFIGSWDSGMPPSDARWPPGPLQ